MANLDDAKYFAIKKLVEDSLSNDEIIEIWNRSAVSLDYLYCDTKISYYNRTWERFDYESVLARAIEKYPKSMQAELREQIIERKAKAEHEKCEAFIGAFENLYNGLSDENKEILKEKTPTIETEEQAEAVMGVMKLMTILG